MGELVIDAVQFFLRDADARIPDGNPQEGIVLFARDGERAGRDAALQTVHHRVFDQRLKAHARNAQILHVVVDLKDRADARAEAKLLNGQIAADDLQLVGQAHDFPALDGIAQQLGEVLRRRRDLRNLAHHGDGADGLQRIVQKVRVDLAAQELQLQMLLGQLALIQAPVRLQQLVGQARLRLQHAV